MKLIFLTCPVIGKNISAFGAKMICIITINIFTSKTLERQPDYSYCKNCANYVSDRAVTFSSGHSLISAIRAINKI
jgi:hypothetical protein